jgi:hypothetical protein
MTMIMVVATIQKTITSIKNAKNNNNRINDSGRKSNGNNKSKERQKHDMWINTCSFNKR